MKRAPEIDWVRVRQVLREQHTLGQHRGPIGVDGCADCYPPHGNRPSLLFPRRHRSPEERAKISASVRATMARKRGSS